MLNTLNRALQLTLAITFVVIVLGAYTRLRDAGLGCPDWPGCYGKIFAPSAEEIFSEVASAKAWIEMIHRYVAGTLGLLILFIAIQGIRLRHIKPKLWILTTCTLLLVVYQALLGMWTVTMFLNPLVVMGHLLGGFTIIGCLWWIFLQVRGGVVTRGYDARLLTSMCLIALIAQIALGGWTSANYAALPCTDFPTCNGHLWPTQIDPKVNIQIMHRIGALITTILCSVLVFKLFKTQSKIYKVLAGSLIGLLSMQISLGIINVLAGLPIYVSLAHSAVAVLLLLCLLSILYVAHVKQQSY